MPNHKSKKSKIVDTPKEVYKLRNWSEYNTSLKNRGKITIWLSDDVANSWYYEGERAAGGEVIYSDVCIEFCLTMRHLFKLGYRQTEGFSEDIIEISGLGLLVPSYSQIQRRSKSIEIDIRVRQENKRNIIMVIDSTGLKVYGEGEWKVRKHGWNKYRTWRKLHMGSDGMDLEILSVTLTKNDVDDAEAGKEVIDQLEEQIDSIAGDGAYDKINFRSCLPIDVAQLIPPRKDGVIHKKKAALGQRNKAIERIEEIGRAEWKKEVGYHIRSKSEVNMYRYKVIFGQKLKARKSAFEDCEIRIKSKILNKFVELGMPKSYKVAS